MKKVTCILLLPALFLLIFNSCSGSKVSKKPQGATMVTSDIDNFYSAFDLAVRDTANAEQIFKENYFKPGSKGLRDFSRFKIRSTEDFSRFVIKYQDFYRSIRADISSLSDLEEEILLNFRKLEELYPGANYPDIYFLVGRFSSNGTISKNGLLIGTEILARTAESDTAAWNEAILEISMMRSHIPVTASHELVHFNQDNMKSENTLLWKSIREGSAEFIAELISGETDADYSEFKGIELEIWNDFKVDMHKRVWTSWQQAGENRPRNAGYWAGYMICKAYLNEVRNEKKAVADILTIRDYKEFLRKSKVDEFMKKSYGE